MNVYMFDVCRCVISNGWLYNVFGQYHPSVEITPSY